MILRKYLLAILNLRKGLKELLATLIKEEILKDSYSN